MLPCPKTVLYDSTLQLARLYLKICIHFIHFAKELWQQMEHSPLSRVDKRHNQVSTVCYVCRAPLNWTPCYGALEVSVLLLLLLNAWHMMQLCSWEVNITQNRWEHFEAGKLNDRMSHHHPECNSPEMFVSKLEHTIKRWSFSNAFVQLTNNVRRCCLREIQFTVNKMCYKLLLLIQAGTLEQILF